MAKGKWSSKAITDIMGGDGAGAVGGEGASSFGDGDWGPFVRWRVDAWGERYEGGRAGAGAGACDSGVLARIDAAAFEIMGLGGGLCDAD